MSLFSKKVKKSKTFKNDCDFVLLEGDCYDNIKKLPDNSVKLIITYPPYNLNKEYDSFYSAPCLKNSNAFSTLP